ncbi:MAG: hypothetical protein K5978_01480 [Campylobacter sp.]|nr:hypothetical protein [Campylobacter sp.]
MKNGKNFSQKISNLMNFYTKIDEFIKFGICVKIHRVFKSWIFIKFDSLNLIR